MDIDLSTIPDAPKNEIDLSSIPDVQPSQGGSSRTWEADQPEASWGEVEKTVAKNLPINLAASATGAMAIGADLMPVITFLGLLKEPIKYAAKYWSEKAQSNTEKLNLKEGSAKSYASMIQESMGQQAPLIAGGALTGGTGFILPAMGVMTAGQKKSQFLSNGIEGGNLNAIMQGVIEAATEKIPLGQWFKPGASFMKRLLTSTAAEIPGEQIATITQGALDKVALNPEMSWDEYLKTLPSQMKDTLVVTIGQSLLMAGPMQGMAQYSENRQKVKEQLTTQFQVPEPEAEKAVNEATQNIEEQSQEPVSLSEIFDNPEEEAKKIRNAAIIAETLKIDTETAYDLQDDIVKELENKVADESPVMVGEPQEGKQEQPKQPWEMTREEFENNYFVRGTGNFPSGTSKDALGGQAASAVNVTENWKGSLPKFYSSGKGGQVHLFTREQMNIPEGDYAYSDFIPKGDTNPIRSIDARSIPEDVTNLHKYMIQQALSEGKQVPPEVLKDYPELQTSKSDGGMSGEPQDGTVESQVQETEITTPKASLEEARNAVMKLEIDKDVEELRITPEKEKKDKIQEKLEAKYDRIITKVGQHWFSQMVKFELEKETLLAKSMTLYNRRKQVRNIQKYFGIPNDIMKKVTGNRDIGLMSDASFKHFKDSIQTKAVELEENQFAKAKLVDLIHQKRLQKVENYRRVLGFPSIDKMTTEQLQEFTEALEPFSDGDTFLTERELEVVDRTDLKGIRTWREARERLAKEAGTTVDKMEAIKVSELDEYRYDTALAERNPFYKLLVTETTRKLMEANGKYYEIEQKVHDLATKSNASRQRTLINKLIPQDKQIMDYLEAKEEDKPGLLNEMTPEQINYAHFIQEYFGQALEYLIKTKALTKGRENYFVHMRRTFLEDVKEAGLKKAVNNIFNHYKQDEAVFNILDEDTANILPLEKFFQFALHRNGGLDPTTNITRAFLGYVKMFEKKVSLDELIPKMDIYAQSLTPTQLTPRGLEIDRSIKKFVNKYINNKKGRRIRWLGKQNGKIDMATRAIKTFTSILDLGLNIPVQIASTIGEQVTSLEVLGVKKYALGTKRLATPIGRKIAGKYKEFTGRTAWDEITEPDKQITERLSEGLFGLFRESTARANQQFLLGSLTKEEFESGEVSSNRLAELSLEMGRWRQVDGSASLVGSTTSGGAAMQYKKWAVPIMRTTMKDISTFATDIKNKGVSEALNTREAQELKRLVIISTVTAITGGLMVGDEDDESFTGKLRAKAYREMMTLMQGVGIKLWLSVPRTLTFLAQLGNNIQQILTLEEYKTKEGYKGVEGLKKQLTPVAVQQLTPEEE